MGAGFQLLSGIGNFMAQRQMADQLEDSADLAEKLSVIEARRVRRDRNRRLGTLAAQQGASGFQMGSGTPLAIMADEAFEAATDVRLARLSGQLQATDIRRRAATTRTQSINSLLGGFGSASSSLISGINK